MDCDDWFALAFLCLAVWIFFAAFYCWVLPLWR